MTRVTVELCKMLLLTNGNEVEESFATRHQQTTIMHISIMR